MDNITEQQYESILHYMQQYHQDNFQLASKVMKQNDFSLDKVRQKRAHDNHHNQNIRNGIMEHMHPNISPQEMFQLSKMRQYLLTRLHTPRRPSLLSRSLLCLRVGCRNAFQCLIPEIIKRRTARSSFYRIYQDECVIELTNNTINDGIAKIIKEGRKRARDNELARNGNNNANRERNIIKKSLFIIVSQKGKNHCIIQLLRKKKLLLKIAQNFQIVGTVDTQLQQQMAKYNSKHKIVTASSAQNTAKQSASTVMEQINPPTVLILRHSHMEQLQPVEKFHGEREILGINQQTIQNLLDKIQQMIRKDSEMFRRISQKMLEQSYGYQMNGFEGFGYANGIRRIADHDDGQQDQDQQQQYIRNVQASSLIKNQNAEYINMQSKQLEKTQQKEAERKKQQEEMQQFLQQRKCRKLSMPEQPSQQEQAQGKQKIVKVLFRCPNGDNINRKFLKDQKIQILFMWVELNDDIEFESDQEHTQTGNKNKQQKEIIKQRNFDLLHSYPPESLKDKMDKSIGEIFEDENQIKILIRQL